MSENALKDKLQRYMQDNGLNMKALADLAGIPYTTVANFMARNSDPRISTIVKLAKQLDCSVDALISADISYEQLRLNMPMQKDEALLLELFRQLPYKQKIAILGRMSIMVEELESTE